MSDKNKKIYRSSQDQSSNQEQEIPEQFEKYEKLKDIGKGSFGKVSLIKRRADGKILVWKELNYGKMSEKEKQMLVSEVNILRELNHPNVVKYYDRVIDRSATKIYIVMEYCEGGDISTLIKNSRKERQFLPEDMIWIILSQVLQALQACHTRKEGKILHRDLKPGNIFLDEKNNVKLGDFGLSRMMNQDSIFAYTHVGTPYYMSPEQINDQKYNEKSDVWSAGCIIYELSALRAPFEATTHLELANKIRSGHLDRLPSQYSDSLMQIIKLMLEQKPDNRPSVQELLNHEQIQVRVLEKKYKDKYANLKKKEADICKKEKELDEQFLLLDSQNEEEKKSEYEYKKIFQNQQIEIEKLNREIRSMDSIQLENERRIKLLTQQLQETEESSQNKNKIIDEENEYLAKYQEYLKKQRNNYI